MEPFEDLLEPLLLDGITLSPIRHCTSVLDPLQQIAEELRSIRLILENQRSQIEGIIPILDSCMRQLEIGERSKVLQKLRPRKRKVT